MALLSGLNDWFKKRLQETGGAVADQVNKITSNPADFAGRVLGQGPLIDALNNLNTFQANNPMAGQAIRVGTQAATKMAQDAANRVPKANVQVNTQNPWVDIPSNLALGIPQAFLNAPHSAAQAGAGAVQYAHDLLSQGRPDATPENKAIGNIAGMMGNAFSAVAPFAGAGSIKEGATNVAATSGILPKVGVAAKQGFKTGFSYGAPTGLTQGLQEGSDLPVPQQLQQGAVSGLEQGLVGGALGSLLGVGGTLAGEGAKVLMNPKTQAQIKTKLADERGSAKLPGGQPTLKDYGITEIKNTKDFNAAVKKVQGKTGMSAEDAQAELQMMLDQARQASVNGMPKPPATRVEITGKAAKDANVKEILETLGKTRTAARTEESLVAAEIATKARALGVKVDKEFITKYEAGKLKTPQEKEMGGFIKAITDSLFAGQQKLKSDIPYRDSYLTHYYDQPEELVQDAVRRLNTNTKSSLPRSFNSYKEAESFGLSGKYKTVDQILGVNARELKTASGNREAISKGLDSGVFDVVPTRGWAPVSGFFDQSGSQVYAQKSVADTINGVMQRDTTGLGKTLHTTAKIARTQQDIALQGGVPGTDLNFFTAGQAMKDTSRNIGTGILGHPIQAIKQEGHLIGDLVRGNSVKATQERFASGSFKAGDKVVSNPEFIRKMSDRGLDLSIQSKLTNYDANPVAKGWDTLGNNPTFGRYMPNRLLSTAQETYAKAIKKGLSEAESLDLAASTAKTFNGIVDQISKGRGNLTQDAMSTGLFAPRYREAIVNSLGNVVKSVADPRTYGDQSFRASREMAAGLVATLAGYEALNYKLNGHSMAKNRIGQELSLQIPVGEKDAKGNQQVINIPFMPGYMTIPRALFNSANAFREGRVKDSIAESGKLASMPLQTVTTVLGNKDYKSEPIYIDQNAADELGVEPDSAVDAAAKAGGYVVGQFLPAWARAPLNQKVAQDAAERKGVTIQPFAKGSNEQLVAEALELPVRFGRSINPDTTSYFKKRDEVLNKASINDRNGWNAIHPKTKDKDGNYIAGSVSSEVKYAQYQQNPNLFEMDKKIEGSQPKHDPIFDLTAQQRQAIFNLGDTLAIATKLGSKLDKPTQDYIKTTRNSAWYQDFQKKRGAFYDELKSKGQLTDENPFNAGNKRTQAPPEVQAVLDQIGEPNVKTAVLFAQNPEAEKWMSLHADEVNQDRIDRGLPALPKYPSPPNDAIRQKEITYAGLPQGTGQRSAFLRNNPDYYQYYQQKQAYYALLEGDSGGSSFSKFGSGGGKGRGPGSIASLTPSRPTIKVGSSKAPSASLKKPAVIGKRKATIKIASSKKTKRAGVKLATA